jgi:hypothetical protein
VQRVLNVGIGHVAKNSARQDKVGRNVLFIDVAKSRSTVDRPPDYASRPGVEDDGAVDLSFSRRVLCHVGDPEFIGLVAMKLARDPIFCGRDTSHATKLWSS